jgi:uncharacterized membrane-anchored protein YhcB (DUF1043 family)
VPTWVPLAIALLALCIASAALLVSIQHRSNRPFRKLREEVEDGLEGQRREIIKLRDEWADYADKITKRYRNAARTLAELDRRSQESVDDEEPADDSHDDAGARPPNGVQQLPAYMVASGAFGAGRAG